MSDIPTDLFHEILKRLPVESLLRFRSVCKTWLRIIDDPAFPKQHIHRGIGQGWFFLYRHRKGKIYLLPVKDLIYTSKCDSYVHWVDTSTVKTLVVPRINDFPFPSCNGLILLSSCKYNKLVLRIWNPFTGESLELGQLANVKCRKNDDLYYGIGYDEANDDYKVVRIVGFNTYLYSVNYVRWHKIGDFPDSIIKHKNGVFAYGALHWVAYSRERNGGGLGWIVALDLNTGNCRKIALPSELTQGAAGRLGLNALSGCLFLSCSNFRRQCFVAWMIKDYNCEDTWIKMILLEDKHSFTPLAYLKRRGQVLIRRDWDYLWYDVERKCKQRLSIELTADDFDNKSDRYEYIDDTFSSQVFHVSLTRLKRSDVWDESVASRTSKRKRKRTMAITER